MSTPDTLILLTQALGAAAAAAIAGWADPQHAAGIAACFKLVSSLAGLAGRAASLAALPAYLPWFLATAIVGAIAGARLSLKALDKRAIMRVLGAVLGVAAATLVN